MPRIFFVLTGFLLIGLIAFVAIQYAKGLRFNPKTLTFNQTGILVATSQPDGAQVFVNARALAATNENLTLAPDTYDLEITKEGYFPWKKRVTIKASEVVKTASLLFPKAPTLAPLTFDGALKAFVTQDGTKLAWIVKDQSSPIAQIGTNTNNINKTGLWVIELSNLPFGFAREAKQITDIDATDATIAWSTNGRQILIQKPNGASFIIESGKFTPQASLVSLPAAQVAKITAGWKQEETKRTEDATKKLPEVLQDILNRKTSAFVFSPDDTKVLYTASTSSNIPDNLIPPVPGSSSQKQERDIKINHTYVYDIKEDRNFLVDEDGQTLQLDNQPTPQADPNKVNRRLSWFPTSRHLVLAEPEKITILEYDGTNRTGVWSGPYNEPFAFVTPDGDQLIILTNFSGRDNGTQANLYTINLK